MDSKQLRQIVEKQNENAKLDFKIKLYEIYDGKPTNSSQQKKWENDKKQQWAEFVKDIIALANGNLGTATQTAYLIIGVGNELKNDGTPNLLDVGDQVPTRQKILDKVNSYCQPQIPDIQCETILLDGKRLFVISIPPTPYLYRLSKELKTPKKEYSPHAVLIRRADGEETYVASIEEQQAIEHEKEMQLSKNYQQNETQEERQTLSIEIYDRKIGVYRIIRHFLASILSTGTVNIEELIQFRQDTDEALFLFDQEVSNYLQILYKNATELYGISQRLASQFLPIGEERSQLVKEQSKLLIWFTEQFKVVRNLFYKYISL